MPLAPGAGMREGYGAKEEPPKYPNLAARWEGRGQSWVGIMMHPGCCANVVEVKPSPRARLQGILPSFLLGLCIPIGILPPQVGHGSDSSMTCVFAPQTCWVPPPTPP